jgi:23S rRNA (pseudouridine1915-N3)-methyltransferase
LSVRLIAIGATSYSFIKEGIEEYEKRLRKYFKFELVVLPDVKNRGKLSAIELKAEESTLILKQLKPTDSLILLDERGKDFDSVNFARFLQKALANKNGNLVFVIGGMYGFDERLKEKAEHLVSLSRMTSSHQLIRLFFIEQLYRACTILNGEPYHNEG